MSEANIKKGSRALPRHQLIVDRSLPQMTDMAQGPIVQDCRLRLGGLGHYSSSEIRGGWMLTRTEA
jgi:hypothetical protein